MTIRFVPFYLFALSFLSFESLLGSAIPAHKCSKLFKTVASYQTVSNETNLRAAAMRAEKINSFGDIAAYFTETLNLGLKTEPIISLVSKNPFVRQMAIPTKELERSLLELKHSKNISLQTAERSNTKHLSALRSGMKTNSALREYDVELAKLPIENQCGLGSCWVYGSKTVIEHIVHYLKENAQLDPRLKSFELIETDQIRMAIEHYYAQYVFNEVMRTIKNGSVLSNEELFQQGGSFRNFMVYAKEFGVGVPHTQWKPIKSYKRALYKDQFLDGLKELAVMFHEKLEAIRKSQDLSMNKREAIKQILAEASKAVEDNIESFTDEMDHKIKIGNRELSAPEFFNQVLFPAFDGMNVYSRNDFYQRDYGHQTARVNIVDKNLREKNLAGRYRSVDLKSESFDKMILDELQKGKALYISVKIPTATYKDPQTKEIKTVIDAQTGLTTQFGFEDAPLKIRGGHALAIVGAELDGNGRIRTLLIQNSWGEEHGDKGLLHMDISFAWTNLYNVISIPTVIDKKVIY